MKRYYNPHFWLGVQIVLLLTVIADFIDGSSGLKETLIFGVIFILLIGLDLMEIERKRQEEKRCSAR